MEGLLIFTNGTVQAVGQNVDTLKFIPFLENLLSTLRQQEHEANLARLHNVSVEDLKKELESRTN